jgi:hypothetical protein
MIKLVKFWVNPIKGCQEVGEGDLVRPSYLTDVVHEGDPLCIIHEVDYENLLVVLRHNTIDWEKKPYIVIQKDQLKQGYGFFKMF